jgi:hypothetical protein
VDLKKKLDEFGYVEIEGSQDAETALSITTHLGNLRPLNGEVLQIVEAKAASEATTNSFSHRVGYGAFPLHTDTAFWPKPARYIIFQMSQPSATPSVVLPANLTQQLFSSFRASNPVFTRETTSGVSYSVPWLGTNLDCVFFDPCIMRPVNKAAVQLVRAIDAEFDQSIPIEWSGDKVLVVDNWRALHGRGAAMASKRKLTRFYRG